MNGWKNMIEKQLQQRFPYTTFEFVEAGIGSTGTTPGSFRMQNDVLSKGKIDLLFVEAAVNDHTNGFSALEQVRGMEGEVRHALISNPRMVSLCCISSRIRFTRWLPKDNNRMYC